MEKVSYVAVRAASVLLTSVTVFAGIMTGCSGAEEQPAPADSTQQSLEGAAQASHSCALRSQGGDKTQTAQSFRQEMESKGYNLTDDPNDKNAHTITSQSCACCGDYWAQCFDICQNEGQKVVGGYCFEPCNSLCGANDVTYSNFYCHCGPL